MNGDDVSALSSERWRSSRGEPERVTTGVLSAVWRGRQNRPECQRSEERRDGTQCVPGVGSRRRLRGDHDLGLASLRMAGGSDRPDLRDRRCAPKDTEPLLVRYPPKEGSSNPTRGGRPLRRLSNGSEAASADLPLRGGERALAAGRLVMVRQGRQAIVADQGCAGRDAAHEAVLRHEILPKSWAIVQKCRIKD